MIKILKSILVIFVLFSGCEVTPRAALRRQLSGKLSGCLFSAGANDLWRKQCIKESVVYCREAQLEASCAYDQLITNLPGERL
jgi:hypothetical protein